MSPKQIQRIVQIFLSLFSDDWVAAYETLCRVGLDDRKDVGTIDEQLAMLDADKKGIDGKPLEEEYIYDTLRDAKIFFQVNWQFFKQKCAEERLILTKEEALLLVTDLLPCKEVWEDIVTGDWDYLQFAKIARHNLENDEIEKARDAKEEAAVAWLERQQAVRRAIERNMLRSRDSSLNPSRLRVPFAEELEATIVELEMEGVPSGPKEMSAILKELFPHTYPLHNMLNNYLPRFVALKENPTPQLKRTIFEKAPKPETIKIGLFEIDPQTNKLTSGGVEVSVTPHGIYDVLLQIRERKDIPLQDFQHEVTTVLRKIREYCQLNHIDGLKKAIFMFQKKYQEMWLSSDKRSEEALKIGFTLAALGLMHADMSEDDRSTKKIFRKQGKDKEK